MIRNTMLAIAATVALSAAALAPTAASAKGFGFHGGHGFHGGWGFRGVGITVVGPTASCLQYQWVETRRGLRRVLVDACAYPY
jgi:Spy/CpxP family protein refolding chaperone